MILNPLRSGMSIIIMILRFGVKMKLFVEQLSYQLYVISSTFIDIVSQTPQVRPYTA